LVGSKRKMLAARDDLADKIGTVAESRGFTLFGMVNDLLELAIKADAMGFSLREAVEASRLAKEVRDASFILVFESLLYETADLAFERASDKTMKVWYDAGVWLALRYVARGAVDPLVAYERDLRIFSWNIPSITFERLGEAVSLRILSPRFSESYTQLFNRYLEGILAGCGYDVTFNEVGKGNIRLEGRKRKH
jgi:hypothetical protein